MERIYQAIIVQHFSEAEQMAFVAGARQVGKTTTAKKLQESYKYSRYLNWDKNNDKNIILSGNDKILENLPINIAGLPKPLITFDEIHKFTKWKSFLKGFIDDFKGNIDIMVTGSAKLDIYQKGGDSLMGRYFLYRIHPLSVGELIRTKFPDRILFEPKKISKNKFNNLFKFGGFPEPFIKQSETFFTRWQNGRQKQLFHEDIRELSNVQELTQLENLSLLLKQYAANRINYSTIAKKLQNTDKTIKRWVNILNSFYYCFTITPWYKNITKSIIKEPKLYLRDWSVIEDKGAKVENFIACHLLKAVDMWNDLGFGKFSLHYLRDLQKHEVDFLVTKENKPWILLEVKSSMKEPISKNLFLFQQQIQAPHVFQVAFDAPFIEIDCFKLKKPSIVSAKTLLSQLV